MKPAILKSPILKGKNNRQQYLCNIADKQSICFDIEKQNSAQPITITYLALKVKKFEKNKPSFTLVTCCFLLAILCKCR